MNEKNFSFWTHEWMEVQRKYWETWTDLSRQALGGKAPTAPSNPWEDAMDHWWKAVSPAAPAPAHDFFAKMIEQGKGFFQLAESFGKNLPSALATGESVMNWQDALNKTFSDMKEAFSGSSQDTSDATRRLMAVWELPLDTWQRTVSSMSLLPGDVFRPFHDVFQPFQRKDLGGIADPLHTHVDRFLSTPGLGYTRERQEQYQKAAQLWLNYQRAHLDYGKTFARIGIHAVDRFQHKLSERGQQGEKITTVRELYNLWVDTCEEVYAEHVISDDYSQLYGRLINALMAVKRHVGMMMDEAMGALNIPARQEIDTLQSRLQETRRESKALRAEIEALKERLGPRVPMEDSEPRAIAAEARKPAATATATKTTARKPSTKRARATTKVPTSET